MTVDVYRPMVMMLDAIEFAAKQALAKDDVSELATRATPCMTRPGLHGLEEFVRVNLPHLRIGASRAETTPVVEIGAKCQCGARFSLRPLPEMALLCSDEPGGMLARWAFDGLLAHRCEVYP